MVFLSQAGMSLTKLSLASGIIKLFPARESLVSDIPSADGKTANFILQWYNGIFGRHLEFVTSLVVLRMPAAAGQDGRRVLRGQGVQRPVQQDFQPEQRIISWHCPVKKKRNCTLFRRKNCWPLFKRRPRKAGREWKVDSKGQLSLALQKIR